MHSGTCVCVCVGRDGVAKAKGRGKGVGRGRGGRGEEEGGVQGSDAWFMNPEEQAFYRLGPVLGVVSQPRVSDMFVASDWSFPPPVTTDNEDVET